MSVDEVLDFLGVNVLAAADNHVLDAPGDLVVPVGIAAGQVAGMEPALAVDGGGCGLGHLVVALHDVVAPGDKFAIHTVRHRLHNAALHAEDGAAHGVHPGLHTVGGLGHGGGGACLCLTVGDADFIHVHLVDHLLHHLDGAGASGHDARAHGAEIRLVEIRMAQHGNEHGGHAMEAGNLLLVDARQALAGREGRNGAHGHAVGHGGRHGQHHAEAVEHGHLNHHTISGGQIHAVADGFAVVDHVVVGQHHALGEARGAGGVLHIAHIVLVDGVGPAGDLRSLPRGHRQRVLPGQAALLAAFHGDDVAQEGEAAGVQRVEGIVASKLRAQLLHDGHIVAVLVAVHHHQGVGVALAQEVFGLMHLVGGVHRHQHRADLDRGPKSDVPRGHVGGPDGHMVAGLHAHGDEAAGKLVHVVPELAVGAGIVEGGVAEGVLVGELLHHAVQHLGEGQVNQVVLGPDILAGFAVVVLQAMAHMVAAHELLHVIGEMREHDTCALQIRRGVLDPFQADVSLVIHRTQGANHGVDGQVALAHNLVLHLAVFHHGILDVDVLDIHAQVLHSGFRLFPGKAVRMMHVPQRAHAVALRPHQQFPQTGGVGIHAVGFHQQNHAVLLRVGRYVLQRPQHHLVVHLALAVGVAVAQQADVLCAQLFRQTDVFLDFLPGAFPAGLILEDAAGGQAGNFQVHAVQPGDGLVNLIRSEGLGMDGENVVAKATHFNAVEAKVLGHGINIGPVKIGAAQGGECEFHLRKTSLSFSGGKEKAFASRMKSARDESEAKLELPRYHSC